MTRRSRLHVVRDDGAAVRASVEWARWIVIAGVLGAAALAWLVLHAR